jgi:spore maturation protein CgeB
LGATNVHLVYQSYDDERLRPRQIDEKSRSSFGSDVCFIGQYEQDRIALLQAVRRTGARLRFWGPNWRRHLGKEKWARDAFSGDGVWREDYASALNATKIALCFLSKRIPETTTTRTFEIPGCGTFMLAERTDEHLSLFEEGREAEYFSNSEELAEKVAFYLANEDARSKIAAAGYARCIKSGYGDRARMRSLFAIMESISTDSRVSLGS